MFTLRNSASSFMEQQVRKILDSFTFIMLNGVSTNIYRHGVRATLHRTSWDCHIKSTTGGRFVVCWKTSLLAAKAGEEKIKKNTFNSTLIFLKLFIPSLCCCYWLAFVYVLSSLENFLPFSKFYIHGKIVGSHSSRLLYSSERTHQKNWIREFWEKFLWQCAARLFISPFSILNLYKQEIIQKQQHWMWFWIQYLKRI